MPRTRSRNGDITTWLHIVMQRQLQQPLLQPSQRMSTRCDVAAIFDAARCTDCIHGTVSRCNAPWRTLRHAFTVYWNPMVAIRCDDQKLGHREEGRGASVRKSTVVYQRLIEDALRRVLQRYFCHSSSGSACHCLDSSRIASPKFLV